MNYKVYQGTELKQTVTSKIAVMNGLQPNKTYEFGVQPNDGTRDGTKVTKSVTTRGIRFNILKTLTVGSTITLRYEEYPLGIVPIGNEPSGYFGGGNKQNLSAKVISTANGSSVVEVAGNVIEVGGRNLLQGTVTASGDVAGGGGDQVKGAFNGCDAVKTNRAWDERFINLKSSLGRTNAKAGDWYTISVYVKADKQIDTGSLGVYRALGDGDANTNDGFLGSFPMSDKPITTQWQQYSWSFQINDISLQRQSTRVEYNHDTGDNWIYWAGWMLEPGDIATPYAAFVDGDTFTAQPDGTCALFSEYKALYY